MAHETSYETYEAFSDAMHKLPLHDAADVAQRWIDMARFADRSFASDDPRDKTHLECAEIAWRARAVARQLPQWQLNLLRPAVSAWRSVLNALSLRSSAMWADRERRRQGNVIAPPHRDEIAIPRIEIPTISVSVCLGRLEDGTWSATASAFRDPGATASDAELTEATAKCLEVLAEKVRLGADMGFGDGLSLAFSTEKEQQERS